MNHDDNKQKMKTAFNSVSEIVEWISSASSQLTPDKVLLFRGQRREYPTISPSIGREDTYATQDEIRLIDSAHVHFPDIFPKFTRQNAFEVLVKLQHYGIPTRLIDLTSNILVALYMACSRSKTSQANEDGEILCWVKSASTKFAMPSPDGLDEECLPEIIPYTNAWTDEYIYYNCTHVHQDPAKYFMYKRARPFIKGNSGVMKSLRSVIFMKAPSYFPRQKAQSAWYGFFPNKNTGALHPDIRLVDMPAPFAKLCIPSVSKNEMLRQLALIGISKPTLFPEDIDSACSEIANALKNH